MPAIPTVQCSPCPGYAMAYVLAGGRGSRLMELTDIPGQTRGLFRRQIAHHRLRPFQRAQLGHPPHWRCHAVQSALFDPASCSAAGTSSAQNVTKAFDILPASQRISETGWYSGTADAVYQNIDIIESYAPSHMVLLAGDHVYKMDYEPMLQQHVQSGADVTIGCIEVPRMPRPPAFGVMHVDADDQADRLPGESPPTRPACRTSRIWRSPAWASTSSKRRFLFDQLRRDAAQLESVA